MKHSLSSLLSLSFLLGSIGALPSGVRADDSGTPAPVEKPAGQQAGDAKKRWQDLRPQEKERLSRLFEQFKDLGPEAKNRILERLRTAAPQERREVLQRVKEQLQKAPEERALDRSRRRVVQSHLKSLSPEEQEAFRKLTPLEKKEFLEKKLGEATKKQISRLPPALRQKVENLKPAEQIRALQRFRAERVFKSTFQDPEELSRLRALPRKQVLDALRASLGSRDAPRPEWISEATWKRFGALNPAEKALALRQVGAHLAAHRASRALPGADEEEPAKRSRNRPPSDSPRPLR